MLVLPRLLSNSKNLTRVNLRQRSPLHTRRDPLPTGSTMTEGNSSSTSSPPCAMEVVRNVLAQPGLSVSDFERHGVEGAAEPTELIRPLQTAAGSDISRRELLGCEYLSLMNMGLGPSFGQPGAYEHELQAMKLFGKEVIPAFS